MKEFFAAMLLSVLFYCALTVMSKPVAAFSAGTFGQAANALVTR